LRLIRGLHVVIQVGVFADDLPAEACKGLGGKAISDLEYSPTWSTIVAAVFHPWSVQANSAAAAAIVWFHIERVNCLSPSSSEP
jgi:hypothetical protein